MSEGLVTAGETERTRLGLESWFAQTKGLDGAKVTLHPGPQSTGASHESVIFDVTHDGSTTGYVARVEPRQHLVFPNPDLSVEYRMQELLSGGDIPLPALHGFEPSEEFLGAPFYVMSRVNGVVAPDSPPYTMTGWVLESTPDARAQIWWNGMEAMARVHMVDPSGFDFVNRGRPIGLDGEMQYWGEYGTFAAGDGKLPECALRSWDWLVANQPKDSGVALCWGDSRLGNQIFDDGKCVALLDWEMAAVSDPVQDLAWFIYFNDVFSDGIGVPRLAGLPSAEETIERYTALTGAEVRNYDWFYVFGAYRFVTIMYCIGNLMVADGRMPAGATFPSENFTTIHLDRYLEQKGIR